MITYRIRRNGELVHQKYLYRDGSRWHTDVKGAAVLYIEPHRVYEFSSVEEAERFLSKQVRARIQLSPSS